MGPSARTTRHLLTPAVLAALLVLGACSAGSSDGATASEPADATTDTSADQTSTTAAEGAGACPTDEFPDLSGSAGAGEGYAQPSLAVSCTDDELVVTSNGMISYEFEPMTPNALAEQDWEWRVPLQPELAEETTTMAGRLGTIGFSVTGLPIYGAMEGAMPEAEAYGDPIYNGIVDDCQGHTGPASEYHLHAIEDTSACGFEPSPIVGYALDGFPIYGSNGCLDESCEEVVTFTSGWVQTGDPTTDAWDNYTYEPSDDETVLDECNGRVGPDGTYRYYITETFPYTLGCYAGTPTTQTGAAAGPMPAMG